MLSPEYILDILKTECGYRDGDSILVGVSGGADSVALLHLIHAAGIPCAAAHVNYGLRGEESDGDERFVGDLCTRLNVPLYTRTTNIAELNKIDNNLQNAAREFRIAFFIEISSKESMTSIALGHHADDQIETFLINFMRGSGLRGLTGMKWRSSHWIRPFLECRHGEMESYLAKNGIDWRNDSSNDTDKYLRNRLRHQVLPQLEALDDRNGSGIKHSIEEIREAESLLRDLVVRFWEKSVEDTSYGKLIGKEVIKSSPSPFLLFNYILGIEAPGLKFTPSEFRTLFEQQPGRKYLKNGYQLTVDREHFVISKEVSHQPLLFTLESGTTESSWSCEEIIPCEPNKYFGREALLCAQSLSDNLCVRTWKNGDQMHPLGFTGTKKVSDILTEMKVPLPLKENYPVVTHNDEIVWIPGYRIAEKFKVTDKTKTALHIKWNR